MAGFIYYLYMSDVYVMNERRTSFRKTVSGVEENINTFKLEKKNVHTSHYV